ARLLRGRFLSNRRQPHSAPISRRRDGAVVCSLTGWPSFFAAAVNRCPCYSLITLDLSKCFKPLYGMSDYRIEVALIELLLNRISLPSILRTIPRCPPTKI